MTVATSQLPLIVIEGADGAGTTTQTQRLAERLSGDRKLRASATRQPSSGPIGVAIRDILTGKVPPLASQEAFQLMFTADRLDHAARFLRPELTSGHVVVCDRYSLSTAIYLAASEPRFRCPTCTWTGSEWPNHSWFAERMTPPAKVVHDHEVIDRQAELIKLALGWNKIAPRPLLTIVLDVLPDVAEQRRTARGGRAELFEEREFQRRVCGLYAGALHHIAAGGFFDERDVDPLLLEPVVVLNGNRDPDAVAADVWRVTLDALLTFERRGGRMVTLPSMP